MASLSAPGPMTLSDEIQSVVMDVLATRPVAMMLVWETAEGLVYRRSVPRSPALERGLIHTLAHGVDAAG